MAIIKHNATYTRTFLAVYNTDHITGATGLTVIVRLSKAGAAYAAAAGTVTAIGNGLYSVSLTTADTGTLGDLSFNCTGTNVDPTDFIDQIVDFDFNIPVVITGTNSDKTGYTVSTNQDKGGYTLGSGVNVTQWASGTTPAVNVTGVPLVDLKYTLGTISPATAGSVRADAVTGTVGSVTGAVGSVTGAVGSVTGNVSGNVTGSVGSVLTSVITGTNLDKTGYSLSSSQTFNTTGSITGNLSGSVGSVTGAVGSVTGSVGSVLGSVITGTNADKTGYSLSAGQFQVKKNTALNNFMFLMLDSADHVTPKTGLTITSQVSIDGAAFGSTANSASEIGSGIYKINFANTDTNGTTLMFKFNSTGADTRYIEVITQA